CRRQSAHSGSPASRHQHYSRNRTAGELLSPSADGSGAPASLLTGDRPALAGKPRTRRAAHSRKPESPPWPGERITGRISLAASVCGLLAAPQTPTYRAIREGGPSLPAI